jgi:hypothetical protein
MKNVMFQIKVGGLFWELQATYAVLDKIYNNRFKLYMKQMLH